MARRFNTMGVCRPDDHYMLPGDGQEQLKAAGYGEVTTEIKDAPECYYAEDYHQQYLAKNPGGYCGHGGTGVSCPIGVSVGS